MRKLFREKDSRLVLQRKSEHFSLGNGPIFIFTFSPNYDMFILREKVRIFANFFTMNNSQIRMDRIAADES